MILLGLFVALLVCVIFFIALLFIVYLFERFKPLQYPCLLHKNHV